MTSALAAVALVILAAAPAPQDEEFRYPPETPREEPRQPEYEDPGDATVRIWRQGLEGRRYYLRSPRHPLLTNDAVVIKRARISYYYPDRDAHSLIHFQVRLWFEGVEPAPPEEFRFEVELVETLDELYEWLEKDLSPIPLESDHGWSAATQQMVRSRFIAEGMDAAMVGLILGGLEYRVEQEDLADGRWREVWSLKNSRQARKAFSARRSLQRAPLPDASRQPRGFYLFDHDGPEDVSIVFIDGVVAARQPSPAPGGSSRR